MIGSRASRPFITILKLTMWMGLSLSMVLLPACNGGGGGLDGDDDDNQFPPGAVTDLMLTGVTPRTASLRWTAPGEGDGQGIVFEYDLRFAAAPITDPSWPDATQVPNEPVPLPAGMTQTMTVSDLTPASTYHFALKSRDDQGNWSALSNPVIAELPLEIEVIFPDAALEARIREIIQKPDGPIYPDDLTGVLIIEAEGLGIIDLTGLVACTNVWRLNASQNNISDFSPLMGMDGLSTLVLAGNQISDLSPVAGLPGLTYLGIGQNQISDLSPLAALDHLDALNCAENLVSDLTPLAGLSNLDYLYMNGNLIADLEPLAGLTLLAELYASANQIVDLTPLQGLTNLNWLVLDYNDITDLAPLVANPGIGSGDTVRLVANPLSAEAINAQIPALQARGATVIWLPPGNLAPRA